MSSGVRLATGGTACHPQGGPPLCAIDQAAFASKNLYHAANYIVRQALIHERVYLGYVEIFHHIKDHEAYCALPRKVSTDVLRQLDRE